MKILLTACLEKMRVMVKMKFCLHQKTEGCKWILLGDYTRSSCKVMGGDSSGPFFDLRTKLINVMILFVHFRIFGMTISNIDLIHMYSVTAKGTYYYSFIPLFYCKLKLSFLFLFRNK